MNVADNRCSQLSKLADAFEGLSKTRGWAEEFSRATGFCVDNIIEREGNGAVRYFRHAIRIWNSDLADQISPVGELFCVLPANGPMHMFAKVLASGLRYCNSISFWLPQRAASLARLAIEKVEKSGLTGVNIFCAPETNLAQFFESAGMNSRLIIFGHDLWFESIKQFLPKTFVRIAFEGPGNDPAICLPHFDLETSVNEIVRGFLNNGGQSCSAFKSLYVPKGNLRPVTEAIIELVKKLERTDPLLPGSILNRITSDRLKERIHRQVSDALKDGGDIIWGNRTIDKSGIMCPLILSCWAHSSIVTDETFYPVIPIVEYSNTDELIKFLKLSRYRLNASIFGDVGSELLSKLVRMYKDVSLNRYHVHASRVADLAAFGGYKRSALVIDFDRNWNEVMHQQGRFEFDELLGLNCDWI